MKSLLTLIQRDSSVHQNIRKYKDRLFTPAAKMCVRLGVNPYGVSIIGLLIGLVSLGLLFVNYWYFVIGIVISTIIDGIDGNVARITNQITPQGKKLDFAVDLTLSLLTYSVLVIWLEEPLWIIGLNLFGLVLLLNKLAGSPLRIFPGRLWIVLFVVVGLPRWGLVVITLYAVSMYALLMTDIARS